MGGTSSNLITPGFLLPYARPATVSDYRAATNASGTMAVFERTVAKSAGGSGQPQLYILDLTGSGALPAPFLGGSPAILTSTRPDWSWSNDQIAFNYSGDVMVGVVSATGQDPKLFGGITARMNYPTWFPDGGTLATESANGTPNPNTTVISAASGATVKTALEGAGLWGGMPSVNPVNPNLIAFAGHAWVEGQPYQQDFNYIYVMDLSSGNPPVPLEAQAPASGPYDPSFQGRAPWWSPDGKWVVFESNRLCQPPANNGAGMYAIFLYAYRGPNPAMQVTDTSYNCNHAKWYPNGFPGSPAGPFQLIVSAWQPNGSDAPSWPYGLAVLNLTPLGITF